MGYACPVCEVPQADAKHLANHLAFTALIHDGDEHEAWLDEHVPGWGERGEQELAEAVVEHAEDAEYPQVFEDTVHADGEHQHDDERSGKLFEDDGHGRSERDDHGHSERDDHGHSERDDHGHTGRDDHGSAAQRGPDTSSLDPEARSIVEAARELTEQRRQNREASSDDGAENGEE